jgi:hypothetical protein
MRRNFILKLESAYVNTRLIMRSHNLEYFCSGVLIRTKTITVAFVAVLLPLLPNKSVKIQFQCRMVLVTSPASVP